MAGVQQEQSMTLCVWFHVSIMCNASSYTAMAVLESSTYAFGVYIISMTRMCVPGCVHVGEA